MADFFWEGAGATQNWEEVANWVNQNLQAVSEYPKNSNDRAFFLADTEVGSYCKLNSNVLCELHTVSNDSVFAGAASPFYGTIEIDNGSIVCEKSRIGGLDEPPNNLLIVLNNSSIIKTKDCYWHGNFDIQSNCQSSKLIIGNLFPSGGIMSDINTCAKISIDKVNHPQISGSTFGITATENIGIAELVMPEGSYIEFAKEFHCNSIKDIIGETPVGIFYIGTELYYTLYLKDYIAGDYTGMLDRIVLEKKPSETYESIQGIQGI